MSRHNSSWQPLDLANMHHAFGDFAIEGNAAELIVANMQKVYAIAETG